MTVQLLKIGIYSKNGELRSVELKLGSLNIITGESQTGKSALLDIVDYCWGREECTIPMGDIRRSVKWFCIMLDRDGELILIARKNPENNAKTSEDIYLERGSTDLPPSDEKFERNISSSGLRDFLSSILGISENIFTPESGSTRPPLSASAGHAILYSLQFQYEIANPRLMFHRQGEPFMQAAIKDTLPYFLGAMEEDHFLQKKRYDEARTRLRRLERELAEARTLADEVAGTARLLVGEAVRNGLISVQVQPETTSELRSVLEEALAANVSRGARLDDPSADLSDLEERRRVVRSLLQDIREEISDIRRLRRETTDFETEAKEQRARLASLDLVHASHVDHSVCPLCDSVLPVSVPSVAQLERSLRSLGEQLESVERDNPRLLGRLAELEQAQSAHEEELRSIQREIAQRIAENERLRLEQTLFTEQARVKGRIEYYLENVRTVASDDGLRLAIARTGAEVDELARTVDQEALEERVTTALGIVGRQITALATKLQLEHGSNPLRLDRKNLTVVADTIDGPLPLTQIGSGENWVGYHIAAHLALHQLFRARGRPTAAFLILDQPSQAHYPPERDVGEISGSDDQDQMAVSRLYETLFDFIQTMDGRMQIIVTDHVELLKPWFRDSIVQRWRDGIKLVPMDWLER